MFFKANGTANIKFIYRFLFPEIQYKFVTRSEGCKDIVFMCIRFITHSLITYRRR